jgi:hypothetical protein
MNGMMSRKLRDEQDSDKSLLNFTKRGSDLGFMAVTRFARTDAV